MAEPEVRPWIDLVAGARPATRQHTAPRREPADMWSANEPSRALCRWQRGDLLLESGWVLTVTGCGLPAAGPTWVAPDSMGGLPAAPTWRPFGPASTLPLPIGWRLLPRPQRLSHGEPRALRVADPSPPGPPSAASASADGSLDGIVPVSRSLWPSAPLWRPL